MPAWVPSNVDVSPDVTVERQTGTGYGCTGLLASVLRMGILQLN